MGPETLFTFNTDFYHSYIFLPVPVYVGPVDLGMFWPQTCGLPRLTLDLPHCHEFA